MPRRSRLAAPVLLLLVLWICAACGRSAAESTGQAGPVDPTDWKPESSFAGTILFQSDADGDDEIYALTRDGVTKLTDNTWSDGTPRWSPDGRRIAFSADPRGDFDIFAMNPDGSGIEALVATPADETEPDWRPDGAGIAFTRGDKEAWAVDFATRGEKRLVPDFGRTHGILDFSPSAPLAAFTGKRTLGWDVFVVDLAAGRSAPLTSGGKSCRPRFSPDGRTIAFVSHAADGWGDVWTMNPDGTAKTRMTVTDRTADYFPSWSPDGKEIVFCSGTAHSPREGRWTLHILDVATKRVRPLFSAAERALFPDWR
jgi:Tol biopolymer transport system component